MSAKTIRCDRCRRRCRNTAGWNADLIAGLIVGYLCPDCQNPQEDLEAELNLILNQADGYTTRPDPHDITDVVNALVNTYPTPEVLRCKAGELVAARRDEQASGMARLMRAVAERLETGDLWEPA